MDSVRQEVYQVLPKLHPIYKCYIDLKRCSVRLDDFIASFPEDKTNEVDTYLDMLNKINEALELIPREYK